MNTKELRIGNYVLYSNEIHEVLSISSSELRVRNINDKLTTFILLRGDRDGPPEECDPIPITSEWLLNFGAKEQIVCETCAKINTSKLCYKGQDRGDEQFEKQAEINGLYINCQEPKRKTGNYSLFGFNLFEGKTIQHWSREDSWNFANLSWNLNLTIKYVHELQNLYFALRREELIFNTI